MPNQVLSLSKTMISQKQATHIEEMIIMEQVKATHDPSSGMEVDASFVLHFVEDIFNFDTVPQEVMQDKLQLQKHIQKEITSHILQLSFEIACSCLNNADSHSIAIYLLSSLSKYPWHAKVVMMLASFVIIYWKFKVVSQSCQRRGLTYNLALLKQSLNSMPSHDNEKLVDDSIKSVLDLTKLAVELRHSSSMILANYWIARFVVAYARLHILGLESRNQLTEQSNISTKIKEILTSSLPLLEEQRAEENYQALLQAFDHSLNILEVLKLIFNVKNDKEEPILYGRWWLPPYSVLVGSNLVDRSVGLDLFQGEEVLLLITSDKHFPCYAYNAPRAVKMIWVPIINDLEEHIQMPSYYFNKYYCVLDPQKWVAPEFIRFLKDKCFPTFQAGSDPIVISLDKRGRLVHSNALHMIFTWGSQLYEERTMRSGDIIPLLENELRERTFGADRVIGDIDTQIHDFASEVRKKINYWVDDIKTKMRSSFRSYNYTSEREQALWGKESWSLKLVVPSDYYFDKLNKWIDDENYIFLCGGNNINQVQEFALKGREVHFKIQMKMKIAYVGRSENTNTEVRSVCDYVFDKDDFKLFWTRLQSMASSRIQYLNKIGHDEGTDEIMQGLKKLLAYVAEGTSVGAWALLSKGKRIIACDMGDKMLAVINEYEKWKGNAHANGFDQAFKDYYEMLSCSSSSSNQHPCCALNYPSNLDKIPETLSCPQCNHNMHKFVTFSCCHDSISLLDRLDRKRLTLWRNP